MAVFLITLYHPDQTVWGIDKYGILYYKYYTTLQVTITIHTAGGSTGHQITPLLLVSDLHLLVACCALLRCSSGPLCLSDHCLRNRFSCRSESSNISLVVGLGKTDHSKLQYFCKKYEILVNKIDIVFSSLLVWWLGFLSLALPRYERNRMKRLCTLFLLVWISLGTHLW